MEQVKKLKRWNEFVDINGSNTIMIPITISPMKEEDINQVLEIENLSFLNPWSQRLYLSEVRERDDSYFIVAKLDQRIIGYGGFWLVVDEAHLVNIAIHPDFRRQGIGTQIMKYLLNLARQLGAKRATLEVRASNTAALEFYAKFGFIAVALRKEYYADTKEDAVIMWQNELWSLELNA
ncbi:MAG: ribosomal protein S18-alanine N-acetyltransferase [bacterium]